jgi:GNAT superfamily N-acetyltransferase
MVAAEDWARGKGYNVVRLRSNVMRADAHGFYDALGYPSTKTSRVLSGPTHGLPRGVQRPAT